MRTLDNNAADVIPIRLIISVVIIAVIMFLIMLASDNVRISLAEHQIEEECRQLQSTLATMTASGVARDVDACDFAEGTNRVQTLDLPDSLVYLSFGGCPDSLGSDQYQSAITDDGASIFYRVQGGGTHVIWFPRNSYKFREGLLHGTTWTLNETAGSYIIHHGGATRLVFELVQKNHVNYILVHASDEIE